MAQIDISSTWLNTLQRAAGAWRLEWDIDVLAPRLAKDAGELMGLQRAAVLLREGNTIEVRAHWPQLVEEDARTFLEAARRQSAAVMQSGGLMITGQPQLTCCAPLVAGRGLFGALYIDAREANLVTGPHDRMRLEQIARDAAVALDRALIFSRAMRDPETGFFNHLHFQRQLENAVRATRARQSLALILLSVSTSAPEADSHVDLAQIAGLLRGVLSPADTGARFGSTEFELLLANADGAAGQARAEQIREQFAQRFGDQRLSCALGVAAYPENATETAALFVCADEALQAARKGGGNRCIRAATMMKISPRDLARTGAGTIVLQPSVVQTTDYVRAAEPAENHSITRFDAGSLVVADEWQTLFGGWELQGQAWVAKNQEDNILVWTGLVPGSFRFLCEGWHEQAGELSIFGHALESPQHSHWGYAFHVGAESNSCTKLSRMGITVQSKLDLAVEPQRHYNLEIDYDDVGGWVTCYLDAREIFRYRDHLLFPGHQVGFYAWGPGVHLRPIEVRQPARQAKLPPIREADLLYENGDYAAAIKGYRDVAQQEPGGFEAAHATFKIGLCLLRMERVPKAREIFRSLRGTPLEPYGIGEEASLCFTERAAHGNAQRGADMLAEIAERFPDSEARSYIMGSAVIARHRQYLWAPTRAADLRVRNRVHRLARDAGRPRTYNGVRAQIEMCRMWWLAGEWRQALDELLDLQKQITARQQQMFSYPLAVYTCALANNREDLLPEPPLSLEGWDHTWSPDWCSGVLLHCLVRKGGTRAFLDTFEARRAKEPDWSPYLDLRHGIFLAHLAEQNVPAAQAWLESAVGPRIAPANFLWTYWVGGAAIESGQEQLVDAALGIAESVLQAAPDNAMVARTVALLKARTALEHARFDEAATQLYHWPLPELAYHFAESVVLQVLLTSLGLKLSLSREELAANIEWRLAGVELDLARMFLGLQEPRPGERWPHALWRPEWRLWLALWLEAKGDRAGAREVATPAIDSRYGLTHSQPALNALLARLG